jgi:hypothetical protein
MQLDSSTVAAVLQSYYGVVAITTHDTHSVNAVWLLAHLM